MMAVREVTSTFTSREMLYIVGRRQRQDHAAQHDLRILRPDTGKVNVEGRTSGP